MHRLSRLFVAISIGHLCQGHDVTNRSCTTASDIAKGLSMHGKVAVLTGGDSGIALPATLALAQAGATVIIATHRQAHGDAVAKNVSQQTGNPDVSASAIDLGSFDSVRAFASQILAKHKFIDILVNDAGVDGEHVQRITADGYEECIQVNYLGHALLTELLLPALRASSEARVINMASFEASLLPCQQAGKPEDCLGGPDQWNSTVRTFANPPTPQKWWEKMIDKSWLSSANLTASNYGLSKFMLVAHAKALAEREAKLGTSVRAWAMRPGIVTTTLLHHFSWVACEEGCVAMGFSGCTKGVCPLTPDQAAATLTWLSVTNTSSLAAGGYYFLCKPEHFPGTPGSFPVVGKLPWDDGSSLLPKGWDWATSPTALLDWTVRTVTHNI